MPDPRKRWCDLERLKDLLAQADHSVSALEERLEAALAADADSELRDRFHKDVGMATSQVWAAVARYLHVVDGLETDSSEEVVRAARHTGLLGDDEAEMARRLLTDRAAPQMDDVGLADTRRHVRFLRLWLERVRDTAAKAHE